MSAAGAQPSDWTLDAPLRPGERGALEDPRWLRLTLIGATIAFLGLFLVLPLATVFLQAFSKIGLIPDTGGRHVQTIAAMTNDPTMLGAGSSLAGSRLARLRGPWLEARRAAARGHRHPVPPARYPHHPARRAPDAPLPPLLTGNFSPHFDRTAKKAPLTDAVRGKMDCGI